MDGRGIELCPGVGLWMGQYRKNRDHGMVKKILANGEIIVSSY